MCCICADKLRFSQTPVCSSLVLRSHSSRAAAATMFRTRNFRAGAAKTVFHRLHPCWQSCDFEAGGKLNDRCSEGVCWARASRSCREPRKYLLTAANACSVRVSLTDVAHAFLRQVCRALQAISHSGFPSEPVRAMGNRPAMQFVARTCYACGKARVATRGANNTNSCTIMAWRAPLPATLQDSKRSNCQSPAKLRLTSTYTSNTLASGCPVLATVANRCPAQAVLLMLKRILPKRVSRAGLKAPFVQDSMEPTHPQMQSTRTSADRAGPFS